MSVVHWMAHSVVRVRGDAFSISPSRCDFSSWEWFFNLSDVNEYVDVYDFNYV